MITTPKITSCPICGNAEVRRVCKTVTRTHAGRTYAVPDLAEKLDPEVRDLRLAWSSCRRRRLQR
jgi:hypothetical protein